MPRATYNTSQQPLSPEAIEWVVDLAKERIQTIDGHHYLDGYRLPPDDDELFEPVVDKVVMTILDANPRVITKLYPSQVTNRTARAGNLEAIARGLKPTFLTWSDLGQTLVDNPHNSVA